MKTEDTATSSTVWTTNVLPHLTHEECLPVIGSCQVSTILSNLEVSENNNVEIPQNVELIVLQNTDVVGQTSLNSDFVIIKENEEVIPSTISRKQHYLSGKGNCDNKYLFCELCPFLCTNEADMSTHTENAHMNGVAAKLNTLKCPGCANIFYHRIALRSHLVYDHAVGSLDLLRMVHSAVSQLKKQVKIANELKNKPESNILLTTSSKECMKDEKELQNIEILHNSINTEDISATSNLHMRSLESLCDNSTASVLNLSESRKENNIPIIVNLPTVDISKDNATKIFNNYIKPNMISKYMNEKKTHKCIYPLCKVRFGDSEKMNFHVKCHMDTTFRCPECQMSFIFWKSLTGHLWRMHKIDMDLFSCDKCDYKTFSLAKLNNIHKLIHSDMKAFKCDTCDKAFKNSKQLRNHKTTHKLKEGGSSCFCDICKKHFYDKRQLKIHVDGVHNKIKPFLCNFCGYKGATRGALKVHIRQHTGEKPFTCDSCTFATSDHNSLRRHKLRHSGQRPYKCSHCDYACIQSSTYKVHLKTKHPGLEKDLLFCCRHCPFRTINRDIFSSHLNTVHKQLK